MHESGRAASPIGDDVVFVLGAGVDRVFGLPLVNSLFRDLSEFARGPGAAINRTIRDHAPRLPLNLEAYAGDQAENLGQRLLGSDPDLLRRIVSALDKHRDATSGRIKTIKALMQKLTEIGQANELDEATMAELSRLAGATDPGVSDTLIDPQHVTFRPKARDAIKAVFTQVVDEIPNLTPEEKSAFQSVIALLSNFEQLLAELFAGYFTNQLSSQKKYFYLAWLLWAYIRHKEESIRTSGIRSFYDTLAEAGIVGKNIITFNYTDFFSEATRPKEGYFHGDNKTFIRLRSRELVADSVQMKAATTLSKMATFIAELRVDWKQEPAEVCLPAMVPPLAMKPIICSEYLERWYLCAQCLKKARTIFIVGYSFNVADEHFNDLIRKGNQETRLIVVDPDVSAVATKVCRIMNHEETALQPRKIANMDCYCDGRLTFVKGKAEQISKGQLDILVDVENAEHRHR
jgi:hypothetical protein